MKKYSIWLLGFAALVAGACSTDRTGDETLALSASSVSANKRGMTYEGGDVTFDVLSNVYWVINLDEDADWLTVAPRAAYGNQTVKVTAAVNPGGRRSTTLRFDSLDGVTAQIEVTQGSSDELIYYIRTGAGASAVAEPVAVGGYTAWEPEGVGASAVGFSGVNAFVSADTPSSGYDEASGGNNIVLEVPGEGPETVTPSFSVRDVATRDDSYFRLKMGVLAPGGELTPDRFRVLVGNGGDELIALQYEVIDGAGDWKEVLARFWVGEDNPTFDFKVEAPRRRLPHRRLPPLRGQLRRGTGGCFPGRRRRRQAGRLRLFRGRFFVGDRRIRRNRLHRDVSYAAYGRNLLERHNGGKPRAGGL